MELLTFSILRLNCRFKSVFRCAEVNLLRLLSNLRIFNCSANVILDWSSN